MDDTIFVGLIFIGLVILYFTCYLQIAWIYFMTVFGICVLIVNQANCKFGIREQW